MRFELIHAEKAHHSVQLLCRALAVSPSGYYAWARRKPSKRSRDDEVLSTHLRAIHKASRGTYGSPRLTAELAREGFAVSRKRVVRLMKSNGLRGLPRKRYRTTTDSKHGLGVAPNVLDRQFTAAAPDQVWVGDITYVSTWEGWLYLAVLVDLYSRRVVGWAVADNLGTDLALEALEMALRRRRPEPGLLHHTDRGTQYASHHYQQRLARHGLRCSMSRPAECLDNAVAESFFGTLKTELVDRYPWPTRREATEAIEEYIEVFYDTQRLHSHLAYVPPAEFERQNRKEHRAA